LFQLFLKVKTHAGTDGKRKSDPMKRVAFDTPRPAKRRVVRKPNFSLLLRVFALFAFVVGGYDFVDDYGEESLVHTSGQSSCCEAAD
jgi:hypothetical protein